MSVPIYSCPVCNRKYTSIKRVYDLAVVRIQENRLINLNLQHGIIRKKLEDPEYKSESVRIEKNVTKAIEGEQLSSDKASGYVTFRNIGSGSRMPGEIKTC